MRARKVASMAQVTSKSTAAPFSAATAEKVLVTACEIAGLDTEGTHLLRLGENALFHLPSESAVVRIARTMEYWRDAAKEVAVARSPQTISFQRRKSARYHSQYRWLITRLRFGASSMAATGVAAISHILAPCYTACTICRDLRRSICLERISSDESEGESRQLRFLRPIGTSCKGVSAN